MVLSVGDKVFFRKGDNTEYTVISFNEEIDSVRLAGLQWSYREDVFSLVAPIKNNTVSLQDNPEIGVFVNPDGDGYIKMSRCPKTTLFEWVACDESGAPIKHKQDIYS